MAFAGMVLRNGAYAQCMRLSHVAALAALLTGCAAGPVEFDHAAGGGAATSDGGASSVASSTTSGTAGGGGGAGGIGGEGGQGGAPECPAPACEPGQIQCGCDEWHAACDGLCTSPTFGAPLPFGQTAVRLGPIADSDPACADSCNGNPDAPAVSLTLRLPPDALCVSVDGPVSLRADVADKAGVNGFGPLCGVTDGEQRRCGLWEREPLQSGSRWLRLAIAADAKLLPQNGAVVRVTIGAPGTCEAPECKGDCAGVQLPPI